MSQDSPQQNPEQSVQPAEARLWIILLQNGQLLSQGQVLGKQAIPGWQAERRESRIRTSHDRSACITMGLDIPDDVAFCQAVEFTGVPVFGEGHVGPGGALSRGSRRRSCVGGFQLLGALTTSNDRAQRACRPFDASRNGTVLGEGAAVFVLEPLEKALAEGKEILAEVRGYGSTLDAHSLSAPDPEGDGAARSMKAALDDAGVAPDAIAHINAHGTGTALNDKVEAMAIRRVFDGFWDRIPVSATKSMTGHLIGAAGAVEVGACLLALVRNMMPPNPSLERVGQGCELNHVTGGAAPFDGEYALSNSFGFGGQNVTLVVRRHNGSK